MRGVNVLVFDTLFRGIGGRVAEHHMAVYYADVRTVARFHVPLRPGVVV